MPAAALGRTARRAALALALAVASAAPAAACMVCLPMPAATPADALIEAEAVAFAREDPDRPYRIAEVEAVKGEPPAAGAQLFLPAVDRRRLAADPEAVAVLVREPGSETWRRVAVGGAARRAFVRDVVERGPVWTRAVDDAARHDWFAARLDAPQDWLRNAALLELARAPYPRIRAAAPRLPEAALRAGLDDPVWLEWRPIHILMLGARGTEAAAEEVRARYARTLAWGPEDHLGAWAVALIEVDGAAGLARVARDAAARPNPAMTALVQAISVQAGEGDPTLRGPAAAAYAALLADRPEAAGLVARDLAAWEDWSLAPAVRAAAAAGRTGDAAGLYAAVLYVGLAKDRGGL